MCSEVPSPAWVELLAQIREACRGLLASFEFRHSLCFVYGEGRRVDEVSNVAQTRKSGGSHSSEV